MLTTPMRHWGWALALALATAGCTADAPAEDTLLDQLRGASEVTLMVRHRGGMPRSIRGAIALNGFDSLSMRWCVSSDM